MKKMLRVILTVFLSGVLLYSLTHIVMLEIEYKKADIIYKESRSEHFNLIEDASLTRPDDSKRVSGSDECFPEVSVDIKALKDINPDIAGWIWIAGTDVSFPLLHADDNTKYLNRSYDLQWVASGSIFIDYRNLPDLSCDNTVIYGHNMNNGGMFGGLKKYSDIEYLKENCCLYIFTETRILKYRIFAAYKTESTSDSYTMDFSGDIGFDEYMAYISSCAGESLTDEPQEQTPLIMLSTCTSARRSERFVVHASYVSEKAVF